MIFKKKLFVVFYFIFLMGFLFVNNIEINMS